MMEDLIERLEKAEAGSRELSDEVLKLLGYKCVSEENPPWYTSVLMEPNGDFPCHWQDRPCPTTSLDAALALVPEGWAALASTEGNASVWQRDIHGRMRAAHQAGASTPALALCIAILKAKAAVL